MTFQVIAESTINCPNCGTSKTETMPTDACQFFYDCTGCGTLLRPKPGDCCVFCSFGSVPCAPIQKAGGKRCLVRTWITHWWLIGSRRTPFTESPAQRSGIGLVNRPSVQR